MDIDYVDHYVILGLPSGEDGAKVTKKEISKAYRLKALELHPDKNPDDPNAHGSFRKLKTSHEILKDENARKLFDDLLRVRNKKITQSQSSFQDSSKRRRKMMSDLEERERSATFAARARTEGAEEEERIAKKLKDEIARIRALFGSNISSASPTHGNGNGNAEDGSFSVDKKKILEVSWEKIGGDYSARRLREIFGEFGIVEDVVIKNSKKKRSALVVMSSKDANVAGDLSNPLLVLPLNPFPGEPQLGKFTAAAAAAGYRTFEDSVLQKMKKAAEKQNY